MNLAEMLGATLRALTAAPRAVPPPQDSASAAAGSASAATRQATMMASFPISAIDVGLLTVAAPHLRPAVLEPWVAPIRAACVRYEIDTIRRVAAFITTLAHEGGFRIGARENMAYSAKRMAEVWARYAINPAAKPKDRLPNAAAKRLAAAGPEAIANDVYANRMGNGPPASGDGWKFRGNGPPQLTGANNHRAFARAIGMDVDAAASWIGTIEGGVAAAGWFWDENNLNRLADTPGIEDETIAINGGTIGIANRRSIFNAVVAELLRLELREALR
jgi:putative chitinase